MKCESIRRKRLPRGRHISKSAASRDRGSKTTRDALNEKIDRLEALVNVALSEGNQKGGDGASVTGESTPSRASATRASNFLQASGGNGLEQGSNFMASQYWASLINEIRESRGATDDTEGDEDEEEAEDELDECEPAEGYEGAHLPQAPNRGYLPFMGLSLGRLGHTLPRSLSIRPSPAVTAALCDIYLNQVDRIIKLLHRPSLKRHLLEGTPYPALKSSPEAESALDIAVFYAAVASMTDRQSHNLFQCSRDEVLPEYQGACEMALERTDLARTTDITVLQAFVLYLVCLLLN